MTNITTQAASTGAKPGPTTAVRVSTSRPGKGASQTSAGPRAVAATTAGKDGTTAGRGEGTTAKPQPSATSPNTTKAATSAPQKGTVSAPPKAAASPSQNATAKPTNTTSAASPGRGVSSASLTSLGVNSSSKRPPAVTTSSSSRRLFTTPGSVPSSPRGAQNTSQDNGTFSSSTPSKMSGQSAVPTAKTVTGSVQSAGPSTKTSVTRDSANSTTTSDGVSESTERASIPTGSSQSTTEEEDVFSGSMSTDSLSFATDANTMTTSEPKYHNISGLMKEQICSQERHYSKPNPCPHANSTVYCIFRKNNSTYGENNTRVPFESLCNEDAYFLFHSTDDRHGTNFTNGHDGPLPVNASGHPLSNVPVEEKGKSHPNTLQKCFCELLENNGDLDANKHCRCYPSVMGEFLKKRTPRSLCSFNMIFDKTCNITKEEDGKRNATCIIPRGIPKPFTEVNCNDTSLESLLRSTVAHSIDDLLSQKQRNCLTQALKECPKVCDHAKNTSTCLNTCNSVCTELCQTRQVVQKNYETVIDEFLKLNPVQNSSELTVSTVTTDYDNSSMSAITDIPKSERNRREIEEFIYNKFGGTNNTLGMKLSRQVGSAEPSILDDLYGIFENVPIVAAVGAATGLLLIILLTLVGVKKAKKKKQSKLLAE